MLESAKIIYIYTRKISIDIFRKSEKYLFLGESNFQRKYIYFNVEISQFISFLNFPGLILCPCSFINFKLQSEFTVSCLSHYLPRLGVKPLLANNLKN